MDKAKLYRVLLFLIFLLSAFHGCHKHGNPVLEYFENAELQVEDNIQEKIIIDALNDILRLSASELMNRRYGDYEGEADQWDLPTLIYRHFVPDQKASLGDNFYHDVKARKVQKKIKEILEQIEEDLQKNPNAIADMKNEYRSMRQRKAG